MSRNVFSIRIILLVLCLIVLMPMVKGAGPKKSLKCVAPAYLKQGDKVALISPSYYCSVETASQAADTLRSWGFVPVIGPNVGKQFMEHYAGTVEERLADLRWALRDPDIKAIICLRGGYSTLHLVEGLSLKELAASPKWLIGYSDITTLLSMEVCAGVMSIHGVMGCNIANQDSVAVQQSCTVLRNLLQGQVPRYELSARKENIPGRASGTLVGGNLATFAPLLGSQVDAIGKNDIILFVEEVDETYHNIDRLFNMLKMSGVLAHCKGVVLGDFTDCKNDVGYESVEAMLREYIMPYNIPLLCGFPAGHEKLNLPIVIGATVTMEVRADGATLIFDISGDNIIIENK
ncbi:MAG: LD-carboxypeptidase [Bacteroidales bacterium]|nr:LD-carboxypeptidase [Bacteroidales bacterium]